MPEPNVVTAEEDKPAEPESSAPAASSGPTQPTATVETPEQTYRTVELLKHWPAVLLAVQKSKEAYSSVKQSATIIRWSLDLTEKAVGSVLKFAENKASSLRPVIQYADKAVSNGVVAIEKKFPAVRESPKEFYDTITQLITKMVRPALDKTASISEIGRKKLNRIGKKTVKQYHRFLRSVDRWLERMEKRLNSAELKELPRDLADGDDSIPTKPARVSSAAAAGAPAASATPVGGVWRAVRLVSWAAMEVASFQVGAACWLLARVPLVAGLFGEPQDQHSSLTSSSSSSSSSSDVPSSSSSRLSPPAAAEEPPLSAHSLHPEPLPSLPRQTTA